MNYEFGCMEREHIHYLLHGKHHLKPVFTNVQDIPQRVKEYDPELFIVFNTKNQRFEIHSKDGGETTYNATIPYKDLDERTIRYIRKNDIRVHGMAIYDRIAKSEQQAKERKEKERKQFTRDFAAEFQSEFAKDAWVMG